MWLSAAQYVAQILQRASVSELEVPHLGGVSLLQIFARISGQMQGSTLFPLTTLLCFLEPNWDMVAYDSAET